MPFKYFFKTKSCFLKDKIVTKALNFKVNNILNMIIYYEDG